MKIEEMASTSEATLVTMLLSLKEIDLSITEEVMMLKCMRNLRQSSNCSLLTTNFKKKTEREISLFKTTKNKKNPFKKSKTKKLTTHFCITRFSEYKTKIWLRKSIIQMKTNFKMILILKWWENLKILLIITFTKELLLLLHLQKEFC